MKSRGHGNRAAICKACANARQRAQYRADPQRRRARSRAYARTAHGRELNRLAVARWQASNPEKVAASRTLRDAIRRGIVAKPNACQVLGCNARGAVAGHHNRYDQPLSVDWVCPSHHRAIHAQGPQKLKPSAKRKFARAPRTEPAHAAA